MNYVNVQSYLDQDLEKESIVEVKVTLLARCSALMHWRTEPHADSATSGCKDQMIGQSVTSLLQ